MPTFKITLAYDGTEYVGWQRQIAGASIQGEIEEALAKLDQTGVAVTGAGRTDAGVHALGQVASFSIGRAISGNTLVRALNARLPSDIRVLAAEEVPASFHARFQARSKTYRYRIWNGEILSPFERRYAWHVIGALDVSAMAQAARSLEGRHDFAAFEAAGSETHSSEREVISSRVVSCSSMPGPDEPAGLRCAADPGALVAYEITGGGFLRHMVRNIVGTLVAIGRGRRTPDWVGDLLASRDRTRGGPTAPATGLVLVGVEYDEAADRLRPGSSLAGDS